jgi:MFS transporter, DHA1 family, staphyloferrin B biosynthesis exporter
MRCLKALCELRQACLIVFSQFIIILAIDMSTPYWPLILSAQQHFSARVLQYWSGAIYIAPLLTTVCTTLFWTKIGQRFGYKKMVLRASITLAMTQGALFFLHDPVSILGIRLLQGALAGFSVVAQAWALATTPTNTHGQIISHLQAATAVGSIVGPIIGGFVAHYLDYTMIFLVAGILCLLITCVLAKFLKEHLPVEKNVKTSASQNSPLQKDTRQNLLLFLICGTQMARWMSAPFFAWYVVRQLQASNLILGYAYAAIALTMSLTSVFFGKKIDKRQYVFSDLRKWLILALLIAGLTQWGLALTTQSSALFIFGAFWGMSLGLILITLFSLLLKETVRQVHSRSLGLGNTALKLGNLLGIVAGTFIQSMGNFFSSFMIIGCFYFLLAGLTGLFQRTHPIRSYS